MSLNYLQQPSVEMEGKLVLCLSCGGEGWMMQPDHEGEMCPDCQNPLLLGGTGFKGGALPSEWEHLFAAN